MYSAPTEYLSRGLLAGDCRTAFEGVRATRAQTQWFRCAAGSADSVSGAASLFMAAASLFRMRGAGKPVPQPGHAPRRTVRWGGERGPPRPWRRPGAVFRSNNICAHEMRNSRDP
jgi:hypothetical protein